MAQKMAKVAADKAAPAAARPKSKKRDPAALLSAAEAGDVAKIASEIAKGADPDAVGGWGMTALMRAVYGQSEAAVRTLLACGASADPPVGALGSTALLMACDRRPTGALSMVEQLLEAGADPDRAAARDSPLAMAAWSVPLIKRLLARGASVSKHVKLACPIWRAVVMKEHAGALALISALTPEDVERGSGLMAMRQIGAGKMGPKGKALMEALLGAGVSPTRRLPKISVPCSALETLQEARMEWADLMLASMSKAPKAAASLQACVEAWRSDGAAGMSPGAFSRLEHALLEAKARVEAGQLSRSVQEGAEPAKGSALPRL